MTSTIGIILNVLLDIALIGLLAFVMSRATKLTPHRPAVRGAVPQRSPMPPRHIITNHTATRIRTARGMTRLRIDPVRK
jgi:hypothetical protein